MLVDTASGTAAQRFDRPRCGRENEAGATAASAETLLALGSRLAVQG